MKESTMNLNKLLSLTSEELTSDKIQNDIDIWFDDRLTPWDDIYDAMKCINRKVELNDNMDFQLWVIQLVIKFIPESLEKTYLTVSDPSLTKYRHEMCQTLKALME